MTQYELIPTHIIENNALPIPSYQLPEVVHLDDPAYSVMTDFSKKTPLSIQWDADIATALQDMKIYERHLLLVRSEDNQIIGLIASEDILGEKPVQIQQERRISRENITVKMLMTPIKDLISIEYDDVLHHRVGNIVATLRQQTQHYAAVISQPEDSNSPQLRGLFNTSQISKQLHMDVFNELYHSSKKTTD